MEIKDLVTIIREDYLDDAIEDYLWPDAFMYRALTEAERQACNRTDFLYDETTAEIVELTLVEGQQSYAIHPKVTFIDRVEFDSKIVTHISLDERDRFHADWRTASGLGSNDMSYWVRHRKIYFDRTPDAIDAGSTVYLRVYRLPLESITGGSDELEIPEEFHTDLIQWVLYQAYTKQDADGYDANRAKIHLRNFENAFGNFVPSEVRLNQMQEPKGLRPRAVNYLGTSTNEDADW